MKAVRIHQFGGLDALVYEDVPRPVPGKGEVLVRVGAAGVGPWDALIRSGQSKLGQPLPLTLGSDLSGVVAEVGPGVSVLAPGEAVFGATNPQFTGAYAEYAVAEAAMLAPKPSRLSDIEAASVPVVAVTAWQMLFDYGKVDAAKRVLVQGAAGNVGAYAVQLAKEAGAEVTAAAFAKDVEYVLGLGADHVINVSTERFEDQVQGMDIVLDLIGGETLARSFAVLKPGGALVSVVTLPDQVQAARHGIRGVFFYVNVTTQGLTRIADLFDAGRLTTDVGEVLPLAEARLAHEMLDGKPHQRGKIILSVNSPF
jgi:NADPH:quinone reductase-like Zn-dependent oxidoreductase